MCACVRLLGNECFFFGGEGGEAKRETTQPLRPLRLLGPEEEKTKQNQKATSSVFSSLYSKHRSSSGNGKKKKKTKKKKNGRNTHLIPPFPFMTLVQTHKKIKPTHRFTAEEAETQSRNTHTPSGRLDGSEKQP